MAADRGPSVRGGVSAGRPGSVRTRSFVVAGLVVALAASPGVIAPAAAAQDPVIAADEASVVRGGSADIPVLANDQLGDPMPAGHVGLALTSAPVLGTATVEDPDGTGPTEPVIRYTVATSAALGEDTFTYQVSVAEGAGAAVVVLGEAAVSVRVANAAPSALADTAEVASSPGTVAAIPVTANDTDPDGGILSVTGLGSPAHGTVALVDGVVTYDPQDEHVGPDQFTYELDDGQGGSAQGTVTVTVRDATSPMVLRPDVVTAPAGVAVRVDVLANDDSGGRDPLLVVGAGPAGSGASVVIDPDGRTVAYAAPPGFSGEDAFAYQVRDRRGNEARGDVRVMVTPQAPGSPAPPAPEPTPLDPTPVGPSPTAPQPAPAPRVDISVSGPLSRRDVPYSYRPGCPVRPAQLRRMSINHWDYSGKVRRGTLVVRAEAVPDLTHVFTEAFARRFPIKKMRPADAYYKKGKRSPTASDRAAMAAGNTSAFNCRPVVGNPTKRSAHSYGVAIDINTFENPYVVGRGFHPAGARAYLKRKPCRRGMICPGGVIATAMRERGWPWGARWARPDYQHFSANGG